MKFWDTKQRESNETLHDPRVLTRETEGPFVRGKLKKYYRKTRGGKCAAKLFMASLGIAEKRRTIRYKAKTFVWWDEKHAWI